MRLLDLDTIPASLAASIGSMLVAALLLTGGLLIAGTAPAEHLRWYAACFVPPLLLLRHHIGLHNATATKTLIVTLFLTFIPFMAYLLRTNTLLPQ